MTTRTADTSDAKALSEIYAPYVKDTAITFEYEVPSESEFAERISRTTAEYPYIVAVEGDEVVGYAYASQFHGREAYRHCAETSIYVKAGYYGNGIGKALYARLEELLFKQNVFILYACITVPDNAGETRVSDRSAKFHRKLGYTEIGKHYKCGYKFGSWYTIVWMEKLLCERPAKPEAFIPFPLSEKETVNN